MNGLPIDTTFEAIEGREISMVRMGKFQLHYILAEDKPNKPDAWIEIESDDLTFTSENGEVSEITDFKTNAEKLCSFIGLTIKSASRKEDGGLELVMSSGIKLAVNVHSPAYESVVIHIGEKTIVG